MLFVIFIIPRKICNMDMQWKQMDILLHVCIIFQIFNKLSYFRIQQIKLSFIHLLILILQNFSLFPICEIFNITDHTRTLNFIICICIKLHIHLYKFSNIYFLQCTLQHWGTYCISITSSSIRSILCIPSLYFHAACMLFDRSLTFAFHRPCSSLCRQFPLLPIHSLTSHSTL